MYTLSLKYGSWENRVCFRPLPATGRGVDCIDTLLAKVDEIGEQCRAEGDGDMDFLTRVTSAFREAGYARIQP
ncbi:hypothetical protein FACS1894133_6050 [Clostridia bacterium]|nr:hypothetical protein FACS1894133_6050 [Clostridia bacterium]